MKFNDDSGSPQFESSDLYRDFGNVLLEVCQLLKERNYSESLRFLEDFYSKNASRDQNNQHFDKNESI